MDVRCHVTSNAGISGHPGGSTPGDPGAFVKSALTNAF